MSPGPDAVIRVVSLWSSSGSSTSSEVPVLARPTCSSSRCGSDFSSSPPRRARSGARRRGTSPAQAGLSGLGLPWSASPACSPYRVLSEGTACDGARAQLPFSPLSAPGGIVAVRRTASGRAARLQLDARRHTAEGRASFATRCFDARRSPPGTSLLQKNAVSVRGGATWSGTRAQDDINYPSGSHLSGSYLCDARWFVWCSLSRQLERGSELERGIDSRASR
jgi:hypothetical protein